MKNRILALGKNAITKLGVILLAGIYATSPVDLFPDVPPVGWSDDVVVILIALFYCLLHGESRSELLTNLTGTLKWLAIGVSMIMLCIMVVCITLTIHLFH